MKNMLLLLLLFQTFLFCQSREEIDFYLDKIKTMNPDLAYEILDIPTKLQNNTEVILAAVKLNGHNLKCASSKLQNNKEIVLAAVKENGTALYYASKALKNNKEIVLAAVSKDAVAIQYASLSLRDDFDIVKAAGEQNWGIALLYASPRLKNRKEFVLSSVKHIGKWLEDAPNEFKNNKEIVMAAVEQDGNALEFASSSLCNDKDVAQMAVEHGFSCGDNSEFAKLVPSKLRNSRELALALVKHYGNDLGYVGNFCDDKEIVRAAIRERASALQYASRRLRNDKKMVLEAVKSDGKALEYASVDLKDNKEIVIAAVSQNPDALEYASEFLQKDSLVVASAKRTK
jgi:uncharacterized pyridoxamine 5'-phosphate oxidase family protein